MRKVNGENKMSMWKNCHKKGQYFLIKETASFSIRKQNKKSQKILQKSFLRISRL